MTATAPELPPAVLTAHLRRSSTGRLTAGTSGSEISLYLVDGHLVAARADDDTRRVVDRLARRSALPPDRTEQLRSMAQAAAATGRHAHDPVLSLLADEIVPDVLAEILAERFHENVCRFLAQKGSVAFEEGVAPWTENLQIGHHTGSLVSRCALDVQVAHGLSDHRPVVAGPTRALNAVEQAAAHAVRPGRVSVADVVASLDLEPIAARVAVVGLIDRGVLADPPPDGARRPVAAPATRPPASQPGLPPRTEARPPSQGGLPPTRPVSQPGVPSRPAEPEPRRAADPRALSAHRAAQRTVPDDELDAFSGALDGDRGGGRSGAFVAARQNLERVEIEADPPTGSTSPDPAFAPPSLSDRDVLAKIDVTNGVLVAFATALSQSRGPGRGAASVQLLVDARPRSFAPVLEDVKVAADGGLPGRSVLANIRRRAATEQRRLLNDALLDLLDRALDKMADELPDDVFDRVLQQVAGYRQRIGL